MRLRRSPRARSTVVILSLLVVSLLATSAGAAHAGTPTSNTPVVGKSTLTETEVLAWFRNATRQPFRATVSDANLVRYYREEGERMGVRWDVAFAQAILETQWFYYPSAGQVRPNQNNFGGMGAFDGSGGAHVLHFPNARTGVRAQMQHLRMYSDPTTNLQGTNLGAALAKDVDDRYPTRWRALRAERLSNGEYRWAGRVPRWEAFGNGMWATDPLYACKVLNLYRQMRVFNGQSAGGLPTNATCLRTWHLRSSNSAGNADAQGFLGRKGDSVLACDWNGNGKDTPATFRDGLWTITNTANASGTPTTFTYGRRGDLPLCGDWNANGKDTVGIVRDGEWHLRNSLSAGGSDIAFTYGRVTRGDVPVVGDWNGNNKDTVGIIRDGEWHLRNTLSDGPGEVRFTYGRITRGDIALVGDWNGNGKDGVGIVRGGEWHLRNSLSAGPAQHQFVYGRVSAGDVPVMGDWNGNRIDTPGIVR